MVAFFQFKPQILKIVKWQPFLILDVWSPKRKRTCENFNLIDWIEKKFHQPSLKNHFVHYSTQ